jgi:hypothetical protein
MNLQEKDQRKKLTHLIAMIMTDGGLSKSSRDYEIYFVQKYIEPCMYFKELVESLFSIRVEVKQKKMVNLERG